MSRFGTALGCLLLVGCLLLIGCVSAPAVPVPSGPATSAPPASEPPTDGATPGVVRPPTEGRFDYQLGGAYPLPAGVTVVVRDRQDAPAANAYSICYVNGFQAQPDARTFWLTRHPGLVLTDHTGEPVVDADWNELVLDTRTAKRREAIAAIVGEWIAGCAQNGFQAVEIDNLDSYARSHGAISQADNVAMMGLFADVAHAHGLAIAQKNAAELLGRRAALKTDFAIAEQCNQYAECDAYVGVYGGRVFVIEYRDDAFAKGCRAFPQLMIVRRDLDLLPAGAKGHLYRHC